MSSIEPSVKGETSRPSPAPQKTRRTHTKSRGGCMECKRRKLKCNEAKPICSGCTKREISCVYPKPSSRPLSKEPSPVLRPGQTVPIHGATVLNHGSNQGPSPERVPAEYTNSLSGDIKLSRGVGQFDMEDMALWHQFIYTTASTLSNPWGHELPALALTCDYLLHGILCLGALHLAYIHSSDPSKRERYKILAEHHFSMAIGPYQKSVQHVSSSNANQLFAFSTLLIVINYAYNRGPGLIFPFSGGDAYEGVSNWIAFIRGCTAIFESAQAHIEKGPLGFLITQGTKLQQILSTGAQPHPDDERSLARVKDEVLNLPDVKRNTSVAEMEAYHDAITRLRALLAASTQPLDSVIRRAVCGIWPSRVSETYVGLIKKTRAPAMIIMAHYCLLFRGLEECWYMEHRGLALFRLVKDNLGREWDGFIEWPRLEIERSYGRNGDRGVGA